MKMSENIKMHAKSKQLFSKTAVLYWIYIFGALDFRLWLGIIKTALDIYIEKLYNILRILFIHKGKEND